MTRNYREYESKESLEQTLNKRFNTAIIGILATFEEGFGELWGHNKSHKTKEELEWFELWKEVRDDVLNKGHLQRKLAAKDLGQYDIRYSGYKVNFIKRR